MEPSPQVPHEGPAKDAANEKVERGSMARFKALTAHLFAVSQDEFRKELAKDEKQRRAKRGP
jgi:hypothetical protein